MSTNRARRVAKEVADIHADTTSNILADPIGGGDDLTHLKGSFKGPPGTPYEGGTYMIDIRIPSEYPFRPPIMKFETKVWHPNVSSQTVRGVRYDLGSVLANFDFLQGAICLDTLSSAWSPVLTIKSALLSLQSLLSTPEPKDPQDAEVASMLMRNPREFDRVAREWAVKHAGAPKRERGEGSGGSAVETPRQREQRSREEEERARLAAYVFSVLLNCAGFEDFDAHGNETIVMRVTTKI